MIKILLATPQDLDELNALAFTAKSSWGYPKQYLETWHEQIIVQPEMITNKRIYKSVDEKNNLIGFYGLKNNSPKLILEGFWVKPEEMGKGIGKMLFEHMITSAQSLSAQKVEWESDPNAYAFYLHMGAKKIGEKTYILDGSKRVLPIMQLEIPSN
ncbi:MAG: hypothetical protein S4CHLAM2_17080 [Chlamydiales bacterium]|nr:hypothetical protein [Chlamydiales bacterium]